MSSIKGGLTSRTCVFCLNSRFKKLGSNYFRCIKCKSILASSIPNIDELKTFYSSYIPEELNPPPHIYSRIEAKLNSMSGGLQRIRYLDAGFGSGYYLKIAEKLDWELFGQEIVMPSQKVVVPNSVTTHIGELTTKSFGSKMHLISAVEVIEHVLHPEEFVKVVLQLLEKDGTFFGSTPNASSINSYLLRSKWSILNYPEHLYIPSRNGLEFLLVRVGYERIKVRSTGLNPYDFFLSLKRFIKSKGRVPSNGFNRVIFGYKLGSTLYSNKILLLFLKASNFLIGMTGVGDGLQFSARKISEYESN